MKTEQTGVVEKYIGGLKRGDLSDVPLAPDVTYKSPLSGGIVQGPENLVEFLSAIFPLIRDTRIFWHMEKGDLVCTLWELEIKSPEVVIPVLEYFRLQDGQLKEIRPFYDPRPITNPTKSTEAP